MFLTKLPWQIFTELAMVVVPMETETSSATTPTGLAQQLAEASF
jgi:hypothetical protein